VACAHGRPSGDEIPQHKRAPGLTSFADDGCLIKENSYTEDENATSQFLPSQANFHPLERTMARRGGQQGAPDDVEMGIWEADEPNGGNELADPLLQLPTSFYAESMPCRLRPDRVPLC
jgi:hypothetical protein